MGLLDSILGAAGTALSGQGAGSSASPDLLQAVLGLLSNDAPGGGLPALVQRFEQGGLGGLISSWISTGQNLPISAEQLQSVLGSDTVQGLAAKLGLPEGELTQQLSQILPQVVDRLTPQGQVPQGGLGGLGDLLGQFMRR